MSDKKIKSGSGVISNSKQVDLPAMQMGVEVLTDNGQLEIQKPPETPFTVADYSTILTSGGDEKGAEDLTRQAKDALTKEGKQMAEDFQLIKRKEFINAESEVADKEAERKRLEEERAEVRT